MKSFLKRSGLFIARFILSAFALFCIALIALQIILVVGINTVSTGRGSAFLSEKVNEALAGSGYKIGFDALYYDPVQGISLHNIAVSDATGPFLLLDRFSLNISFMLSPLRTLNISANGGTLQLSRLPVTQEKVEEQESAPLEPFTTPDIYFRKIALTDFSFKRVILEEPVMGQALELSPALRAEILLDKNIALSMALLPGMDKLIENVDAPEQINFSGMVSPEKLDFIIDRLAIEAPSYTISGKGTGNIGANGIINMTAKAEHKDLSGLTQDALQEASAALSASGPLSAPAIDLDAKIITGNLKERGLGDISVRLKTDNVQEDLKGGAHIETAFHDDPVTLDADISYTAPELSITNIKGSAPDIILAGDVLFSTQTSLLDGVLTLSAKDLARYKELAGINLAGKVDVKSALKPSASGEQALDVDIAATGIVADTIKVKTLSGAASIASLAHPWPQSAKLQSSGIEIAKDIVLDKLDASVTESGTENYKLALKGAGHVPTPVSFDGGANISELTQAIPVFKDIAFTIHQGGSSAKLSGDFSSQQVALALTAKDFKGRDIPVDLPPQLDKLRIDLDASVTGTPAEPKTEMAAILRGVGAGSYENATINIKATHDGSRVSASITGNGTGIRKLDVTASAPMTWGILPFHYTLDQSAPLQGTLGANLDLAAISPIFIPPAQSLTGTLVTDGTLSGTISAPEPKASIRLSDAQFEDSASGIVIDKLSASANVTKSALTLESLSATDGKAGTINGKGSLSFDSSAANIDLRARNFNAPRSDMADGIISADMALRGKAGKLDLTGKADILEMNVLIPERFSSNIPQLNIVEDEKKDGPGLLESLTLDIAINANNQIFVRGWGLDAEFEGNIGITGTASEPQFNGTFTSRRGRFEEFGKRFKLERANLQFQGSIPPSPYLDIEATTPAGDVTGSVLMTGSVQSPSIKFASTPALPEDEVLSRILFGKDSAKISPFQAVQLAQTIRRFSGEGGGGFDPLATLRSATGLDDISVETDESGATNVGAGKYLTDNVYLELSGGKGENSGEATIQIELTPSINIESEIGQDAQGGGGIFWKHDY